MDIGLMDGPGLGPIQIDSGVVLKPATYRRLGRDEGGGLRDSMQTRCIFPGVLLSKGQTRKLPARSFSNEAAF
jgi:hypothetical protein